MDHLLDVFVRFIARFSLYLFFKRVQVIGAETIPADTPVIFVINHFNSIVDPVVALGKLPRYPRFIATASLWKRPLMRVFLALGRVVPVYRQQDEPGGTSKNVATFERCHEMLLAGGAIALFPEGRSHDEPELQPMKTGVARIALGAEQRRPGLELRIVPVGLTYDSKHDFRSRVLVNVGPPLDPLADVASPDPENRDAVRRVTDQIGEGLDMVTLSYPSWEEARLIERAAELFAKGSAETPGRRSLADDFPVRKAFAEGYRRLKATHPGPVVTVAESVRAYDRMLSISDFRHEHVVSRYPAATVTLYVVRTILTLAVRLPLALVGTVMNLLPYLASMVAGRVAPPEVRATHKILTAVVAAPVTWIAWGLLGGISWGVVWGWLLLALGPLSATVAIHFFEQRRQLFDEARAYLRLRSSENIRRELRERRDEVYRQVVDLANLYLELPAG